MSGKDNVGSGLGFVCFLLSFFWGEGAIDTPKTVNKTRLLIYRDRNLWSSSNPLNI